MENGENPYYNIGWFRWPLKIDDYEDPRDKPDIFYIGYYEQLFDFDIFFINDQMADDEVEHRLAE